MSSTVIRHHHLRQFFHHLGTLLLLLQLSNCWLQWWLSSSSCLVPIVWRCNQSDFPRFCRLQDNWVVNSWRVLMRVDLPRRRFFCFQAPDWFFFSLPLASDRSLFSAVYVCVQLSHLSHSFAFVIVFGQKRKTIKWKSLFIKPTLY